MVKKLQWFSSLAQRLLNHTLVGILENLRSVSKQLSRKAGMQATAIIGHPDNGGKHLLPSVIIVSTIHIYGSSICNNNNVISEI